MTGNDLSLHEAVAHGTHPRRFRLRRAVGLLIVAVVALSTLSAADLIHPVPAAAAPGDPFDPDVPTVFVAQDVPTRLYTATQGAGTVSFVPEGPTADRGYNAIGFNTADNYLYAIRRDGGFKTALQRIGQDGVVTGLGPVSGLPGLAMASDIYNQGDFGQGPTANILYVRSIFDLGRMWAVDVTTLSATPIALASNVPNVSDIVWKDGFLWGLDGDDTMYRIDPVSGAVQSWPTGLGINQSFGAQWLYGNGNLGVSANSTGMVYQIQIADATTTSPTFTLVASAQGPASGNNDGAAIPGLDVDLGIIKAGPTTYSPGDVIDYTLTVTNHGPGVSSGFVVHDSLPASVVSASTATPGCSIAGNDLQCVLGGIPVGDSVDIEISGTISMDATDGLTNTATVAGNELDPNPDNDSSTTEANPLQVCLPVPIWANTADGLVQYDSTTFDQLSTTALERAYGDIAWSSDGATLYAVDYDFGEAGVPRLRTIDPSTGEELSTVEITGPLLTQATVPGQDANNYSLNALTAIDESTLLVGSYASRDIFRLDTATGATTLWTQFPAQISSAGDFTVLPDGDILAFGVRPLSGIFSDSRVFRIHSNGTMTQIGTVPAMWGGAQSGGYFFMTAPSGEINRIALASLPTTNVGTLTYTTVLSGGPEFWGATAVQDAGTCVGLSVTKTPTPEVVTAPGQEVTYTFEVTNISDVTIDDIVLTDVQAPPAGALTTGPTCPATTLAAQASMTCTATYIATQADIDHGRIDDTASATGDADGVPVVSNEATATVLVQTVEDWSIEKTAFLDGDELEGGAMVAPGDTLTYRVTLTSDATVDIVDVVIADDLSDVLDDATFVPGSAELSIDGGASVVVADPVGDDLTAGPFTLPAGATAILTYQVTVDDDAWSTTLTNSVTGDSATSPPLDCDEECTTTQFTPSVVQILKVGENTGGDVVPMDGSAWAIYDAADATTPVVGPVPQAMDGGVPVTGLFRDATLVAGTYWLEETVALDGFELLAQRVEFSVDAAGVVTLAADTAASVTLVDVDGIDTIRVEDVPALELPDAGGPGTSLIYLVGIALILTASVSILVLSARARARRHLAEAVVDP